MKTTPGGEGNIVLVVDTAAAAGSQPALLCMLFTYKAFACVNGYGKACDIIIIPICAIWGRTHKQLHFNHVPTSKARQKQFIAYQPLDACLPKRFGVVRGTKVAAGKPSLAAGELRKK